MVVRVQPIRRATWSPVSTPASDILGDRGILRQWFIEYRLQQEMDEARRYGYALSVVVLSPMLNSSNNSWNERVTKGVLATKEAARTTDLIGWLEGDDILVVLPHTDYAGARAAIERWRNEMYRDTPPTERLKWLAAAAQDCGDFATARGFLSSVCHSFEDTD